MYRSRNDRTKLDVEDGDLLRWCLSPEEELRVEVVPQRSGTFEGFEGYDGDVDTDASAEQDEWHSER